MEERGAGGGGGGGGRGGQIGHWKEKIDGSGRVRE